MSKIDDKIAALDIMGESLNEVAKNIIGQLETFLNDAVAWQMYEKGQDGYGKSLGQYKPSTIKKKKAKGQRYDHITLRDTGAFHRALEVVLEDDGFYLKSNDWKSERWIVPRWSESVFRPDGETLGLLTDEIRQQIVQQIKQLL